MMKILIVGMENTCRSIMAAEYLRKLAYERAAAGMEIFSAGIRAFLDIPAEPVVVEALKKSGITGDFRSRPLARQDIADAGLVLTVNQRIRDMIASKFPDKAEAIMTLNAVSGRAEKDITSDENGLTEIKDMIEAGYDRIAGMK